MNINIHAVNFNADRKLLTYVERKVAKLQRYYDHIVDVEVFMKTNNERIRNKTVELKISMPGQRLFARDDSRKFEIATNRAVDSMEQQVRKLKTKQRKGR